jgi:alpha-amylase
MIFTKLLVVIVIGVIVSVECQYDPHFVNNRSVIVHLFEWKFKDIAKECEQYLGPNGFGGVQVRNRYIWRNKNQ